MRKHPLLQLLAANRGKGFMRAEAAGESATLWLYDAIVQDDYWGGVSAISFAKELTAITAPTIHLHINSPGGDVFAARAMEQLMREHPSQIIAHIDGYAASSASYVALAADQVLIGAGAQYMIHKAWTIACGNADEISKTVALLNHIDASLIETYARETGQDAQQIADWMAAETWFNAEQAVQYGFADAIAGSEDAQALEQSWDMAAYRNAPRITTPAAREREPEQTDRAALRRRLEAALI